MTMYMCIVMNMNIYITKANEDFLKSLPTQQSMSGLINDLLDKYRGGKGTDLFPQFATPVKEPTRATVLPKTDGGVAMSRVTPVHSNGQPVIKTKEDAVETIKQLFPEAEFIGPLYRDKKNKKL